MFAGCAGVSFPQPFQGKPYTYFSKGDQFGRDHLMNRSMVGSKRIGVNGFTTNEVLTLLGQPQEIRVQVRDVAEDWYFVYYKNYKPYVPSLKKNVEFQEGQFVVRFVDKHAKDTVFLS